MWVISFALIVWTACTLYGLKSMSGIAGKETYDFLIKYFGSTAYFIPIFLFYWLWRSIKNRTLAIFTLLLGVVLTLGSLGGEIAFIKSIFVKSSLIPGSIGQVFFNFLSSFSGKAGGAIFCFAGIILGVHILFSIPWVATIRKTIEVLK
ncbi:MAG: DNA translocase FtsK 4TM domain-containing protein, partial [Elusimicrobiaceae bacterium]|nr:DNA translocase FtsK 4TM domain-containing protein [Elusimicrobiaceae bacterium]